MGSITLLDIAAGIFLHHSAGVLIFWAALNTVFMYGLFFAEFFPMVAMYGKKIFAPLNKNIVWIPKN